MTATSDQAASSRPARAAFDKVLCAVDGSRGSATAVRQAIELVRPDGLLTFVCVTDARGVGANRIATVGEHRAETALAWARELSRDRGVRWETELVHSADVVGTLLERHGDHELLVVGSHPESRLGGILTGSVATAVAHRTSGLTLIARVADSPVPFPQRMVVATEAESDADRVIVTAGRLAVARDAHVHVVHATPRRPDTRGHRALGAIGAAIWAQTGCEPLTTEAPGDPAKVVANLVESDQANLLVVGHGGRSGLRALGSVSEQLVHRARCSVLLVPNQ